VDKLGPFVQCFGQTVRDKIKKNLYGSQFCLF